VPPLLLALAWPCWLLAAGCSHRPAAMPLPLPLVPLLPWLALLLRHP
jgi:hypothetical protein